jgi:hypothetical protein
MPTVTEDPMALAASTRVTTEHESKPFPVAAAGDATNVKVTPPAPRKLTAVIATTETVRRMSSQLPLDVLGQRTGRKSPLLNRTHGSSGDGTDVFTTIGRANLNGLDLNKDFITIANAPCEAANLQKLTVASS